METLRQDLDLFTLSLSAREKATLQAATQGFWSASEEEALQAATQGFWSASEAATQGLWSASEKEALQAATQGFWSASEAATQGLADQKEALQAATQGFWKWNTACQADNCRPRHTADPTTDTVKVGQIKEQTPRRMPSVDKENDPANLTVEVEEAQASLRKPAGAAHLEAERRAAMEATRRHEEEAQHREEAERRRSEDEERHRHEEERRRSEEEERRRQEAERAEEEYRAQEPALSEQEADHQALKDFLRLNGFKAKRPSDSVDGMPVKASKRNGLLGTTYYPLHLAVKLGDAKMVGLLLANGADAAQKDSSGKTPAALAERGLRLGKSAKTASPVLEMLRSHVA